MHTSENWNKLTITEKLNRTKDTLNLNSDEELCKLLGVTRRTINNWKVNKSKPSRKVLEKLYRLCNLHNWGCDLYGKDAFLAQYTVAYDSVRYMYNDILNSDDPLSTSNAVHSVCVKIAEIITQQFKTTNITPVIHMHSVYGSPDYGEIMNVTAVNSLGNYINATVDICVKLGKINDQTELVYIQECVNSKGIVEDRRASYVSDFSITKAASLTFKFLNKK